MYRARTLQAHMAVSNKILKLLVENDKIRTVSESDWRSVENDFHAAREYVDSFHDAYQVREILHFAHDNYTKPHTKNADMLVYILERWPGIHGISSTMHMNDMDLLVRRRHIVPQATAIILEYHRDYSTCLVTLEQIFDSELRELQRINSPTITLDYIKQMRTVLKYIRKNLKIDWNTFLQQPILCANKDKFGPLPLSTACYIRIRSLTSDHTKLPLPRDIKLKLAPLKMQDTMQNVITLIEKLKK